MKPLAACFLTTCALSLYFPGHTVHATTLYKLSAGESVTATSGVTSGGSYKTLGGSKDYKAIHRITNRESSNHPCKMKTKMRHLNNYTATAETESLDTGCTKDKITVGYEDTETYVRAVQVCTNNTKIKGLRVWGTKLDRHTGNLTNVARKQDTRTNCISWHSKSECPAGNVASKIKVSYGLKDFFGISLVCRTVIPK